MTDTAAIEQCGATQRRLMEALLQAPEGVSVDGLTKILSITANAVRQHLASLEKERFVARTGEVRATGRPQHLFSLTERGREAFPRQYRQLAEGLIQEVGSSIGEEALRTVMQRMGKATGAQLQKGGKAATIAQTAAAMKLQGYEAAVDPGNANQIVAHNCVFHRLAEKFPSVCDYDLALMSSATGKKVEHLECMVRGGHTCRFAFKRK